MDKPATIEPLELMPKSQWLAIRFIEVRAAILRRREADEVVPVEWLEEFFDLALSVLVVEKGDTETVVATGGEVK